MSPRASGYPYTEHTHKNKSDLVIYKGWSLVQSHITLCQYLFNRNVEAVCKKAKFPLTVSMGIKRISSSEMLLIKCT